MKLWFKYLGGILFGLAIWAVSPASLLQSGGAIFTASKLALNFGWYLFIPLIAVNFALSTAELSEGKSLWKLGASSLAFHLSALVVASALGLGAALLSMPLRVPLIADPIGRPIASFTSLLFAMLPSSSFSILSSGSGYIVPTLFLAFIIGLAMSHDPLAAKPLSSVLDSAARILYTFNTFVSEIAAVLLIPIAAVAAKVLTEQIGASGFGRFSLLLGTAAAAFLFILIPAFNALSAGNRSRDFGAASTSGRTSRAFSILYSALPSAISGFASADLRFASFASLRQSHENAGLKRRFNSMIFGTGLVAGRAGTAFVTAFAYAVVLYSHSPLALTAENLLLALAIVPCATLAASFTLSAGPFAALAFACSLFGRGYENSYVILTGLSFFLSAIGAALDMAWLGTATAVVGGRIVPRSWKEPRHFI